MNNILIITNSEDATADYLIDRIGGKVNFVRFDTDLDLKNFSAYWTKRGFELSLNKEKLNIADIYNVWYRRPKPFTLNTEIPEIEQRHAIEEWQEAIEGILTIIPTEKWINHPLSIKRASYKIEQLNRCNKFGLKAPRTLLTSGKKDLRNFYQEVGDIVIKPISHGYLEGRDLLTDKLLYTNSLNEEQISQFPNENLCPTLFQQKIRKEYDIRITVLDDKLVAVKLSNPNNKKIDIRRDNMEGVSYASYELPNELKNGIISLVKSYGLRFGAVDLVKSVNGDYYFLEINPNGQWAWMDIYGKTEIYSLFLKTFSNA